MSIQDILFIEAEQNFCCLFTKGKEHALVITLKEMDDKLPSQHFPRVYGSFIANMSQIDEITATHLVIAKKAIPISAELKKQLLQRTLTSIAMVRIFTFFLSHNSQVVVRA